ncbi:MAG TPA: M23 family metallopeptidase [Gemmatimonadales bacterium]|nr:M23 family metallopeptidase [Gemmatimonadales bacterium]
MLLLALLLQAAVPAAALTVRVAPDTALVERDPTTGVGYANFDFVIASRAEAPLELVSIVMTAHDSAGRLLLRRFCDTSGLSPCIRTVPDRTLNPGGSTIVYNPFDELPPAVPLADLRYVLSLADTAGTVTDSLVVSVPLREHATRTDIVLPLRGRVLVFDGHDFYAHHRRWNLAHPVVGSLFRRNSGRYAYDFSIVDPAGRMYRGDGARNEDWYSWNEPVLAPGGGTVVAARSGEPDWEIGRTSLPDSVVLARPIALFGNHVVIDHGNGEFSLLAHLRRGSLLVRVGDRVRRGQPVGRVGFSGSVYTIHNHYQLQRGPEYDAEGLPSTFMGVTRVGGRASAGRRTRIDSGDVVESR